MTSTTGHLAQSSNNKGNSMVALGLFSLSCKTVGNFHRAFSFIHNWLRPELIIFRQYKCQMKIYVGNHYQKTI